MSWSITVNGHINGSTEEVREAQEEVVARATVLVKSLEDFGLTNAMFYGQNVTYNLKEL